jgi:MerR family mercuric resistance operon transcriptional regulator
MQISTVAKRAGVGVETVRFYERRGLITQPRRPLDGGFRDYPAEIVDRIRFIRQAQDLGFALKEVDELLSLRSDPSTDCADVRERARAKLEEVNQKIVRLIAIRSALEGLVDACPGQGPAARCCSILGALEPKPIARATSPKRLKEPKP